MTFSNTPLAPFQSAVHAERDGVSWVSSNDVVTSWCCRLTSGNNSSMAINLRGRVQGCTLTDAGTSLHARVVVCLCLHPHPPTHTHTHTHTHNTTHAHDTHARTHTHTHTRTHTHTHTRTRTHTHTHSLTTRLQALLLSWAPNRASSMPRVV